LTEKEQQVVDVLQTVYDQQQEMYTYRRSLSGSAHC